MDRKGLPSRKGFTLIELLVVIAIIGLMSVLAVISFNKSRIKAWDSKRVSDMKSIQSALELYYSQNESYPYAGAANGLGAVPSWTNLNTALSPYLSKLPLPPSGLSADIYFYMYAVNGNSFTLVGGSMQGSAADTNFALKGDIDGVTPQTNGVYARGTGGIGTAATRNCNDPVYCLKN